MTTIRVTASVTFEYDTRDGIVETTSEAVDDVLDVIDSGDIPAIQYTITTEVLV